MSNKRKATEVDNSNVHGFKRGLEADKILGYADNNGQLQYLMQWKGIDVVDLVSATEANIKCPQVVVRFYEDRLPWYKGKSNMK